MNLLFWLVLSYDLLEDRHTVDVPINPMLVRDPIDSTQSLCSFCSAPLLFCAVSLSDINITDFHFLSVYVDNPDAWSMGERRHYRRSNTDNGWVTGHLGLQWNVFSHMMTVN